MREDCSRNRSLQRGCVSRRARRIEKGVSLQHGCLNKRHRLCERAESSEQFEPLLCAANDRPSRKHRFVSISSAARCCLVEMPPFEHPWRQHGQIWRTLYILNLVLFQKGMMRGRRLVIRATVVYDAENSIHDLSSHRDRILTKCSMFYE